MKRAITFGVFDLFHYGHLKLYQNIKKVCGLDTFLVVAVQDSEFIKKTKPNADIYYSTEIRKEMVKSIRIVDEVIVYTDVDETIKNIEFDIFCVGEDQNHAGFQRAIDFCKKKGKQVVYMTRTPNISSTYCKNLGKG